MPAIGPSLSGFTSWVYSVMGVPTSVLPSDSPYLQLAYDLSCDIVLSSNVSGGGLDLVPSYSSDVAVLPPPTVLNSPTIYATAIYNLGGDTLVRIAQDATDPPAEPPPDNAATFWSDLRTTLGVNAMTFGLVQSTSDQGTSTSLAIPDQIKGMTLMNLQQLATPWGRMYLSIAGQWGGIWGIS